MNCSIARKTGIALAMCLLVCTLFSFSTLAEPADDTAAQTDWEIIPIATEAEEIPEYVYYYNGKEKVSAESFEWTKDAVSGKALKLNGENQYLRLATAQVKELSGFTFSTWVKRLPVATNNNVFFDDDNTANTIEDNNDQKLLTVYKNENRYLTVSLDKQNPKKGIDGLCAELEDRGAEPVTLFRSVTEGASTALPVNEWHHVAVVFSDTSLAVYVDGTAFLQEELNISVDNMDLRTFIIGGGFYSEQTLHALLDNAVVYTAAFDANQIGLLAQNAQPQLGATPTTSKEVLATAPPTLPDTITVSTENANRVLGMPAGLAAVLLIILLGVVVLSVVFTHRKKQQQQQEDDHL